MDEEGQKRSRKFTCAELTLDCSRRPLQQTRGVPPPTEDPPKEPLPPLRRAVASDSLSTRRVTPEARAVTLDLDDNQRDLDDNKRDMQPTEIDQLGYGIGDSVDDALVQQARVVPEEALAIQDMAHADNGPLDSRLFERLGNGANKKAYRVVGQKWVVLVVSAVKGPDFLQDEMDQLAWLDGEGVVVPLVGDQIFPVIQPDGSHGFAFVEEYINGVEARPPGSTATTDSAVDKFIDEIENLLVHEPEQQTALAKLDQVRASLDALDSYFNTHEQTIPDFQPCYEQATGRIVTIDPGDLNVEQSNTHSRYHKWVKKMIKVFGDRSNPGSITYALKRAFRKKHKP